MTALGRSSARGAGRRSALIVLAVVAALAGSAAQGCAANDIPEATGGFGTHAWVLGEAHRLATAHDAGWLDLAEALPIAGDPDTALAAADDAADIPDRVRGPAPERIAYLYRSALADLAAGDDTAAGVKVALLARSYVDLSDPTRAGDSDIDDGVREDYDGAVQALTTPVGGERSWLRDDGFAPVADIHALALAAADRARRANSALVSSSGDDGRETALRTIARTSLMRTVNDLSDIIATLHTMSLVDARGFGASGDGTTDDTAAISAALVAAANAGGGVYVPAGTYAVSTITIPDGITVQGAGHAASWLKGGVRFGSRDLIRGLKLGDVDERTHNEADATRTVFEQCRFRGTSPIVLGDDHSCSFISFRDCLVERSFGGWTPECMYNNVVIEEYSAGPHGHVEHITFERCHVGVSNGSGGHDTGSPGGGLVCHVNPRPPYNQGYHDIRIVDCEFETTDEFTLDFDDRVDANGRHTASDVLIEGCTVKGGGYAGEKRFAYSICIEAPEGCVVRDNLVYRGYINTFKICKNEDPDPARRPLIVEGNTFDLTVDNGVDTPEGVSMIRLHGDNNVFRDNTIITDLSDDIETGDAPGAIFKLYYSRNAQVTGNRVYDRSTVRPPLLAHLYAATDSKFTANHFWSELPEGLRTSSEAGTTGTTWTNNTYAH